MADRLRRLAGVAAAHPGRVLAVVLAATAIFAVAARDVRLDNNFAALFATDSEEARFRQQHRDRWGPDDGLLVAVIRSDAVGEERAAVVDLVARVTDEALTSVPELARVDSVTTTAVVGRRPDGVPASGPAFGPRSPFSLDLDARLALAGRSSLGAADLLSPDGRTFLVVGVLDARYDSYESVVGPAEAFRASVEEVAGDAGVPVEVSFSGVAYTRIAAIDQMQSDLLLLSPLATLVMALILWVVFRRVAAVVGPLLAIGAAIVVTAGVVGLAGDDLNQVTIIYPILLMGVVVSSSTHLVHRFYRERAAGGSAREAATAVWARLTGAAFVATVTTAIGFASLVVAEMQILHEFGLYLAAGVLAAFLVQMAVVPSVLVLADSRPPAAYLRAGGDEHRPAGRPGLTERYARALQRPAVAVGALALGVGLVAGSVLVARTAVYDYALTDMLAPDHPVSRGNAVLDRQLAGVVPVEIALAGEPGAFRDPDVLARMDQLAGWLDEEYGIRAMALSHVVRELDAGGEPPAAGVPDDPARVEQLLDVAASFDDGEALAALVGDDWSRARMRGFTPDHGGRHVVELKQRFEAEAARVLAGTGVTARVTGEAPVAYDGMNNLTRELVESTVLALVMIVLAVLALFRDLRLASVAVLPNVVPILVTLALYRLSSEVLDPLPGIVLCIGIGLAADDTIHLVNRWRELRRGDPRLAASEALVRAVVTVRTAMVSSTLVLGAGFLALTLSGFGWNRQLGALGTIVLLLALVSDLVFGVAGLSLVARRLDRRRRPATGLQPDEPTAAPRPVPEPA